MNILVTNDDGIEAPGLKLLIEAAKLLGKVKVLAPERDLSGVGSRCHLRGWIYPREDGSTSWSSDCAGGGVSATPVDCVRYGIAMFEPQLVLVGINNGLNVGAETLCSGTVCAAAMAVRLGAEKALALSMHKPNWRAWTPRGIARIVKEFWGCSAYSANNINLPSTQPKGKFEIRYLHQDEVMDAMPLVVTRKGKLVLKLRPKLDRLFEKTIYASPIRFQA